MVTKKFKFENGDKVTDQITGHTGVITGTCFYITGCSQYLVSSEQVDPARKPYAEWRDENRLKLVEAKSIVLDDSDDDDGPDIPAPIK